MPWSEDAALVAVSGVASYFFYLVFLVIVLIKHGIDGVEKIAKVVPAPRWIEPVAKAIEAVRKRKSR
jgi:hypothetical protein